MENSENRFYIFEALLKSAATKNPNGFMRFTVNVDSKNTEKEFLFNSFEDCIKLTNKANSKIKNKELHFSYKEVKRVLISKNIDLNNPFFIYVF